MGNGKLKWRFVTEKMYDGQWSFGVCLSHSVEETYVYINLFKWSISIGKILVYQDWQDEGRS